MNQHQAAQKRVAKVLERMQAMVSGDGDDAIMFSEMLDPLLDELQSNDAFGTEGQCDPRGDMRDADWSMDCVQGVDG